MKIELIEKKYFWKKESVPVLRCSVGTETIFLAKYSEHEGHVIFSDDDDMFRPVAFLISTYEIQLSKFEEVINAAFDKIIYEKICNYIFKG